MEKILQELDWCQRNMGGSPFQARLSHYSMIAPEYAQAIPIAPSVFVELPRLYATVWDVRVRYESCPPAYKDDDKRQKRINLALIGG